VQLNEIMADNNGGSDWIELFNPSSQIMDISDWSVTDRGQPGQFVFPPETTMNPRSFLLVWCDAQAGSAGLHTGFALNRQGDQVALYDSQSNRVDVVSFGAQIPGYSLIRPTNAGPWALGVPSPETSNQAASLVSNTNLVINEWMADSASSSGDWIEIHNRSQDGPVSLYDLYPGINGISTPIKTPMFIAPKGFLRLWADEKNGPNHLDFKLPRTGATLSLHNEFGQMLNQVTYGLQEESASEGRLPDGGTNIVRFPYSPTPGAPNSWPVTPVITRPPLNQTVAFGSDTAFTVNTTGLPEPVIQWWFNDVIILGATNSLLELHNLRPAQSGPYRVTVTNVAGITEATATLIVMDPPPALLGHPRVTQGQLHLPISGPQGVRFLVQSSTNLTHWITLETNTFSPSYLEYLDVFSTNDSQRFFRTMMEP
jgi:hypothetical protein